MLWLTSEQGQATLEAAFGIPLIFMLLLMLLQPGIVLYDRIVMHHAAAEACRLLATQSLDGGFSEQRCKDIVKRQLSAIPPHDLFHVHSEECSWDIEFSGNETSGSTQVSITNTIKLLPLFDVAGAFVGLADSAGRLSIRVSASAPVQPKWILDSTSGLNPYEWVHAREVSTP